MVTVSGPKYTEKNPQNSIWRLPLVCVDMCGSVFVCVYICMSLSVYMCVCVFPCVYMCVCLCKTDIRLVECDAGNKSVTVWHAGSNFELTGLRSPTTQQPNCGGCGLKPIGHPKVIPGHFVRKRPVSLVQMSNRLGTSQAGKFWFPKQLHFHWIWGANSAIFRWKCLQGC